MSEEQFRELYTTANYQALHTVLQETGFDREQNCSYIYLPYFLYKLKGLNLANYEQLIEGAINNRPGKIKENCLNLLKTFFLQNTYSANLNHIYWTIHFEKEINLGYPWQDFFEQLEEIGQGIIWVNPVSHWLDSMTRQTNTRTNLTKNHICLRSSQQVFENVNLHSLSSLNEILEVTIAKISLSTHEERFRHFYLFYNYNSQSELAKGMDRQPDYITNLLKGHHFNLQSDTKKRMSGAFLKKFIKTNGKGLVKFSLSTKDEQQVKTLNLEEINTFFANAKIDYEQTQRNNNMTTSQVQNQTNEQNVKWVITIDQDITNVSEADLENIVTEVMNRMEALGDGIIWVNGVRRGSIILSLECSEEIFQRINALYRSGDLSTLLEMNILALEKQEPVNLFLWFDNIFPEVWQQADTFLNREQLMAPVFTVFVERARQINLANHNLAFNVILFARIVRNQDSYIVEIKVFSYNNINLPQGFKLVVSNDQNGIFQESIATEQVPFITCQFSASEGYTFDVELSYQEAKATETFVIQELTELI